MMEMSKVLAWVPTALTVFGLVGGGAVAFHKVDANTDAIAELRTSKVTVDSFSTSQSTARDDRFRLRETLRDIAENVSDNEDAIQQILRENIQDDGEVKLEIQKLQNQQRNDKESIERQLNLILRLLQQQGRDVQD